jgi:hypothetical protein
MIPKLKFLYLLFILISSFALAQIDELSIIEGRWKFESDNFTIFEEWTKKSDTAIEGLSYSIENGEKNISERLYILKLFDHIVYIAQPGENNPTLFTLVSLKDNKFIFENKKHDFPQRIIYHFTSNNELNASIEGEINGEIETKDFSFIKDD